ncbi:putative uncharacterized protein [Waddlia chondrophila 2032/99]|uniref:Biotin-protein ligase N-terminal domain-containing protein n=1 Tax=Waddlia chondrophila 2032/99 TaxID=765953 RepID=F8LFE6_9BACT|nr:BPL-N domain-containing protein [Waddlia chondrophila]CCB92214.1 putative uncharacterized protein [Waddlia chondrophila 2032/99]
MNSEPTLEQQSKQKLKAIKSVQNQFSNSLQPMAILVYADEGAGPRSVRLLIKALKSLKLHEKYKLQRVNRKALAASGWEKDASLLIFPGGRDTPYHQSLKGKPNENIRRYVEEGGAYLGICAGGYYGSAEVEFEKGHPLEVVGKRELGFFPGIARGSAFGPNLFKYEDESGSQAAHIHWMENSLLPIYFNGGCAFVDAAAYTNTRVLATYAELPGNPAAVVECSIGKGKAILSGVHPEYAYPHIEHIPTIPSLVLSTLKNHEPQREQFFRSLLETILASRDNLS